MCIFLPREASRWPDIDLRMETASAMCFPSGSRVDVGLCNTMTGAAPPPPFSYGGGCVIWVLNAVKVLIRWNFCNVSLMELEIEEVPVITPH